MLYSKVKRLCKTKGVTIQETEKDCGFTKNYLQKLDSPGRDPGVYKMRTLARYFGISIEELIEEKEEKSL